MQRGKGKGGGGKGEQQRQSGGKGGRNNDGGEGKGEGRGGGGRRTPRGSGRGGGKGKGEGAAAGGGKDNVPVEAPAPAPEPVPQMDPIQKLMAQIAPDVSDKVAPITLAPPPLSEQPPTQQTVDISNPPAEAKKSKPKKPKAPPPQQPEAPPPAAAAPPAELQREESKTNDLQRKVKNLRKKLKMIDELEAKKATGAELNADQLAKIAARGDVEAEIKRWESFEDSEQLDKEIKKLGKKVRQIEELEAKKAAGGELIADQLAKIAAKQKAIEDLKKLEDLKASLLL